MRFALAAALSLFAITGCGAPTTELSSGVFIENMDPTVHPGDDFFQYVNGGWVSSTEIPADLPSYGSFTRLALESQANVRAIIEESAAGDFPTGTEEQQVGDLYSSFMDLEGRNANGVEPIQPLLDRIDEIQGIADLARFFGDANRLGVNVPLGVGQIPDPEAPERYAMIAQQGGLGLPDREFYFDASETGQEILAAYRSHVAALFDLAGFPNPADAAASVLELETRIASAHWTKERTRDVVAMINPVPLEDLAALAPRFAWDEYLTTAGFADLPHLIVAQLDYVETLDEIIASTSMDQWKTYLRWVVLEGMADFLTDDMVQAEFDFHRATLTGVPEPLPTWRIGVNLVNGILGEAVGKIYVDRHFSPEAKTRMEGLVRNLTLAYEESIEELEWMDEETRAEALDKLSKFGAKIGYPDEWRDYSALVIDPDDLAGNVHRALAAEWERQLARRHDPVDRGEWNTNPQTVNAFYSPLGNEIIFPAAILQPPFFDMEADDAVNYGAIGAVIGHEIGHGFDDMGSRFDGDGALRNWWTDGAQAEFEARTGRLVAQYSEFRPFPDMAVNGEFTLGENIGDLGGLSIGVRAYLLSLDGEEAPVLDGFSGVQRVMLGYGQVWATRIRDEALRNQILTDTHAPAVYRTNGIVRNLPEFYEAFGVTSDHALYLPPEARVKIW